MGIEIRPEFPFVYLEMALSSIILWALERGIDITGELDTKSKIMEIPQ